jgi:hypothetical protein
MPNFANADPGQGYLKIKKNEADPKICIARLTIHPKWSKMKKTLWKNIRNREKIIIQTLVNFLPPNNYF